MGALDGRRPSGILLPGLPAETAAAVAFDVGKVNQDIGIDDFAGQLDFVQGQVGRLDGSGVEVLVGRSGDRHQLAPDGLGRVAAFGGFADGAGAVADEDLLRPGPFKGRHQLPDDVGMDGGKAKAAAEMHFDGDSLAVRQRVEVEAVQQALPFGANAVFGLQIAGGKGREEKF